MSSGENVDQSEPTTDPIAVVPQKRPAITSKLWFKNSVAAVIAVAAVTAAIPLSTFEREDFAQYSRARTAAHTIGKGATATIDGQTWTLDSVRQLGKSPSARRAAPRGTSIMVVAVTRTGTAAHPDTCTAYLIDGDRRWQAESAYGGDFWVPPADKSGFAENCNKPGSLQFSFLVPDDAHPSSLDLTNYRGQVGIRLAL